MTRPTGIGSIQAVVRMAYRAVGGLESAADDLGVSLSVLSYGTEKSDHRPGGLGVNYLDQLGRMSPDAALPVAQHFAQLAGGVFHPLGNVGSTLVDVSRLTREFSDVLAVHAEAHSASSPVPNDYTSEEAARQVKEIDELIHAAAELRAHLVTKL